MCGAFTFVCTSIVYEILLFKQLAQENNHINFQETSRRLSNYN